MSGYTVEQDAFGDWAIWDAEINPVLYRFTSPEFFDWVASIVREAE